MNKQKTSKDLKEKSKGGRPEVYTPELAAVICARLAKGDSLRSICNTEGMPARSTVVDWIINDKEGFSAQYARARDVGLDEMADELFDIADDSTQDTIMDDNGNERTNSEVVARSRLRVDTRKWYLSKLAPKKYGDKITQEVVGAGGGPVQVVSSEMSPQDAARAYADMIAAENGKS